MRIFFITCLFLSLLGMGSAMAATEVVRLGDTEVRLVITQQGQGGVTFIALHENESTSVAAAKSLLGQYGGTLIELKHGGGRMVSFSQGGKRYQFDPNRIFTDAGIRKTLRTGDAEAERAVKALADAIRGKLRGTIIALHNSGNGGYSALSYRGDLAHSAAEVHLVSGADPDNFFLVTGRSTFGRLKSAGHNVVLQSGSPIDDGSLSVWAGRAGRTYVNVEAQSGRLAVQKKMIAAVLGR